MSNKRLIIIPEMIPHIVKVYDEYYSKITNKNLKEIGNELNKLFTEQFGTNYDFDESSYRKSYKNIKEGINISLKENFVEDEVEKIARATNKLALESRIAKKRSQEANSIINRVADNELIKDVLIETIDKYEFKDICHLNNKSINKDGTPIYFYSDVHYGSLIDVVNNKYDEKVAIERLSNFFTFVLNDVKKNKYKKIFIVDGADMIEGSCLRISQLVNISQLIIEQSLNYANIIENLIIKLSKLLKDCEINFSMITDSNHTQIRHFSGKPNEFNNEDFALVIANLLKEKLKGIKNIKFDFGDVIFNDISGYNIAFIHGHQTNKNNDIEYLNTIYGEDVDCVIRGHYHSFDVQSVVMVRRNKGYKQKFVITGPSVCGNTDYALSKGYSSMPGALKVEIANDGKISNIGLIDLL